VVRRRGSDRIDRGVCAAEASAESGRGESISTHPQLCDQNNGVALDGQGDLVLVGKIPLESLSEHELELALGEIYELVEVSFGGLAAAAFGREKNP